jgi:hypothetical protein
MEELVTEAMDVYEGHELATQLASKSTLHEIAEPRRQPLRGEAW